MYKDCRQRSDKVVVDVEKSKESANKALELLNGYNVNIFIKIFYVMVTSK